MANSPWPRTERPFSAILSSRRVPGCGFKGSAIRKQGTITVPPCRFRRMTGPMPTRDGDIVISHRGSNPAMYSVWYMLEDRQQDVSPPVDAAPASGRPEAVQLGLSMARESRGALFCRDTDSGTWTKVSG